MKVLNLFGGPGSGKSTTAADLFAMMKWKQINVELVNEFAKDVTWEKRYTILEDQIYISAQQNRKLWRLQNQVDWAITDSPLILSTCYAGVNYFPNTFKPFIHDVYNYYDNVNVFLKRSKPYAMIGRSQTEEQAVELDNQIKQMLKDHNYPFVEINGDENAKHEIFEYIQET